MGSTSEFQQIVRDVEAKYQAEHERVRQWLEENVVIRLDQGHPNKPLPVKTNNQSYPNNVIFNTLTGKSASQSLVGYYTI